MASLEQTETDSVLESAWAQVANLRPRLASQVEITRHTYRDETWYVLADRMTSTHFRCTPAVQQLLSLLDGEHSVAQAWELVTQGEKESPTGREEVLRMLSALQSSGLLQGGIPQDSTEVYTQQKKQQRQRWWRRLANPLALQIPLLDPDRYLLRALPLFKPLFRPFFFWLWLLVVLAAGFVALGQWQALNTHWDIRFMDAGNLLTLWLLYPLVKGLHELGHGLATRVWDGEVHDMGVMLLVFTPVPYVDASASSAFPSHTQRAIVAAAGIMVELLLSALALVLWMYSEPGLLRDISFNVMVIGGVSTLLFNGNPLLRFDGYYVFCDLLQIPNLRARANQYLAYLLKHHVLDLSTGDINRPTSSSERAWLLLYALLAGCYRIIIGFTIALFVAGKFFFIGVCLALWLLLNQIILPLWRMGSHVVLEARQQSRSSRLVFVAGGGGIALVLALFVVPFNDSSHAEGMIALPENASIRARTEGFIETIYKHSGQKVAAGEPLFQLANQELQTRSVELRARLDELSIRHNMALSSAPVESEILKEEKNALQDELLELQQEVSALLVKSPHAGIFSLDRLQDFPGRYVRKGDALGHVFEDSELTVRVVVAQAGIDRIRNRTQAIEVRLAGSPRELRPARALREVPQATTVLPSATLGSSAGGDIAVDARDQKGRQTLNRVFQLDLALAAMPGEYYFGQRAFVRFVYLREPLAFGWYRALRQQMLARFGL